jgi:formaldehyde-activating enzyme
VATRFQAIGLDAETVREAGLRLGTGMAGEGLNQVQIDLVAGAKTEALGDVYALQLTYPRHGFEGLTTILEPNLTVRPATLIVSANELKNLRQANMVYGPTQAAVARAIVDHLERGTIPAEAMDGEVVIVQAAVHPRALDRHALYQSVLAAADQAIGEAFVA